ncbi:MAG: PDZ domain-containing protein [Gammaproteobacteria bacterium]|nr:PDZ domain-containing protein [Gammaproteobacteria bacterium]
MAIQLNSIVTHAAFPARWLIVAGIAWTLAQTVLYVASSPQAQQSGRPANERAATRQTTVDLNAILSRNLFGAADVVPGIGIGATTEVTRLPLELQAVYIAEEVAEESAATVAQKGKPGYTYHIGDKIPGNAVLVEVLQDHIILRRAGSREKLMFPTIDSQFQADPLQDEGVAANVQARSERRLTNTLSGVQSAREFVAAHQARMEADPEQALNELGIKPVSQGSASGYQLGDLAQSPYLSQTGLQPGDVILSVNGRPVGDMQADRLEVANILAQGSARLEVQRGTRRFFVTASLK